MFVGILAQNKLTTETTTTKPIAKLQCNMPNSVFYVDRAERYDHYIEYKQITENKENMHAVKSRLET